MSLRSLAARLLHLKSTPDGWSGLYRNPEDGVLWEKTYPNGEYHGGGEPAYAPIDPQAAQEKYGSH